jgi:hypothetical protein
MGFGSEFRRYIFHKYVVSRGKGVVVIKKYVGYVVQKEFNPIVA